MLEADSDIARKQSLPGNHIDISKIYSEADIKFQRIWTPIAKVIRGLHSRNNIGLEVLHPQ